jgi:2-methylcitrate dehydratase PrpD
MAAEIADVNALAPDFAQVYAEFSSALTYEALSPSLVAETKLNLFDTLACSIAGVTANGVPELRDIVSDWGGKPEASVLWSGIRVPAPQAAWVNGAMAHARDYDDTHDAAVLHAGVSVIPAVIAATEIAEEPISGPEFYTAIAAGLELICRMGMATRAGVIEIGFIYSSLFGYFAATAAACRVLKMSVPDTVNAIGIAFSQAAGTHQVTRDAAWTKRMHPGFAARAAMTSIAMARRGIQGARRIFEGEDGLSRIYLQSSMDPVALRQELGRHYHMEALSYKPYPCCRFNHTAIDAALKLRSQPGFDWRCVGEIRAYITAQANQAVGTPLAVRRAPKTVVQAQFSICYTIACALVNGSVGLADFVPEGLTRQDVADLTARVTPMVDAEFEREWGRNIGPTRVEAITDGKSFTAQADTPKGSKSSPMSADDLRRKLEDCLTFGGFNPDRAGLFADAIDGLVDSADIASDIRGMIAGIAKR